MSVSDQMESHTLRKALGEPDYRECGCRPSRVLPSPLRGSLDMPISEDGRARYPFIYVYSALGMLSKELVGHLRRERALQSLLSRVDMVIEVGGFTEGHEKRLPCSEINSAHNSRSCSAIGESCGGQGRG